MSISTVETGAARCWKFGEADSQEVIARLDVVGNEDTDTGVHPLVWHTCERTHLNFTAWGNVAQLVFQSCTKQP